eukprot:s3250_g6.t2
MDVAEARDNAGNKYSIISSVDISTGFHLAEVVKPGGGMPTSERCAAAMMSRWVNWAGWPKQVPMDLGMHNRGEMQRMLASHGCEVVFAPLETPTAIGKVERAEGIMKAMLRNIVNDTEAALVIKNQMTRTHGYSPAQWVLGKTPRTPGSVTDLDEAGNLGVLEDALDPFPRFHLNHAARMSAQRAFVHLDTSSRIQRALLRNAATQDKTFKVGDLVVYRRDNQQGGTIWSTASRVIGLDPHRGVWLLHEGVPVLVAENKMRAADESETLAYSLLNGCLPVLPEVIVSGPQQHKYLRVADVPSSSAAASGRGQKRETDDILEPSEFETKDKTGKSARSAPKTPGGIEGDVMMANVDSKDHWRISDSRAIHVHVKPRYRDYNPLLEGGVPEGYLAGSACKVRKIFADGSVKDCEAAAAGEDFPKFSAFAAQRLGPDAAAETHEGKVAKTLNINEVDEETRKGMLEARQTEWDKYRSFNAAVVVSGEEAKRLIAEGHQVIPSKWVDTVKNTHESHLPNFVPVCKARLVSCGNFEAVTRDDVRCDSPTSEPESHLAVCSWAPTKTS